MINIINTKVSVNVVSKKFVNLAVTTEENVNQIKKYKNFDVRLIFECI